MAAEVARALKAPLDVLIVRKLGVPWQPELALGAVASGGVCVLNRSLIGRVVVTRDELRSLAACEARELERRERVYRNGRPAARVGGKTVLVVDDGLATGSTMQAAVSALRHQRPKRIVVAVPVAPAETVRRLQQEVDEVVCLLIPDHFVAIGPWYEDFSQLSDDEVRETLQAHAPPDE